MVEELSFEDAFDELRQAVERLENENLPLEESLRLVEHAAQLSKRCETLLEEAELRVEQLTTAGDGEEFSLEPFDAT